MGKQAVETFRNRLENVIEIHAKAEDLTNAEVIGVLELIKMDLWNKMVTDDEEDEGK